MDISSQGNHYSSTSICILISQSTFVLELKDLLQLFSRFARIFFEGTVIETSALIHNN